MRRALEKLFQIKNNRYYSYKPVRRPDLNNLKKTPTIQNEKPAENGIDLGKQLRSRILATGPMTIAEYMREVLTNPLCGYYMQRDVFGNKGDFVTSPEISQIFGELLGVWVLTEWQKLSSPSPFQLVELGPGRGTLSRDVLRVLSQFKLGAEFSLHLVEVSPFLSKIQAQRLCFNSEQMEDDTLPYYQKGETASGTKVYWHRHFDDVPKEFSIILAHEFFDALPVHKFQRVDDIWKEVLIDINEKSDNAADFRFVLSKAQTPMSRIFKPFPDEKRDCLEYCFDAEILVGSICKRIEQYGGIGLIMDYGHMGEKTDTFRAFKQHKLHDPLTSPGAADLTADVDFKHIKHTAEAQGGVICFGPVEQGTFLQRMQGEARLEQLLKNALPENQAKIRSGYEILTQPSQMGQRFKFLSMFPATVKDFLNKFPVNGFH